LSKVEQKTILNILILYFTSTMLIVIAFAYSYYVTEKEKHINSVKNTLFLDGKTLLSELEKLHNRISKTITYPRYKEFDSAIYDIEKNFIFGTFTPQNIQFDQEYYYDKGFDYYILKTHHYYLGAAYIVIKKDGKSFLNTVAKKLFLILFGSLFVIIITSVFLAKLILKPIRDNLQLLDRFIKDTTHELNTPVSTITSNIELLQKQPYDPVKFQKKIKRIKNASMSISHLYEDLVYLTLKKHVPTNNELILINTIIEQRVEYFSSLLQSKSITANINSHENTTLYIDQKKIQRVIDNLLSNAIKYSPKDTQIDIIIQKNSFCVQDHGIGMDNDEIEKIHERYRRFDSTQGGFGIGFNIIYTIAKEYQLDIYIKSKKGVGTCITLSW